MEQQTQSGLYIFHPMDYRGIPEDNAALMPLKLAFEETSHIFNTDKPRGIDTPPVKTNLLREGVNFLLPGQPIHSSPNATEGRQEKLHPILIHFPTQLTQEGFNRVKDTLVSEVYDLLKLEPQLARDNDRDIGERLAMGYSSGKKQRMLLVLSARNTLDQLNGLTFEDYIQAQQRDGEMIISEHEKKTGIVFIENLKAKDVLEYSELGELRILTALSLDLNMLPQPYYHHPAYNLSVIPVYLGTLKPGPYMRGLLWGYRNVFEILPPNLTPETFKQLQLELFLRLVEQHNELTSTTKKTPEDRILLSLHYGAAIALTHIDYGKYLKSSK